MVEQGIDGKKNIVYCNVLCRCVFLIFLRCEIIDFFPFAYLYFLFHTTTFTSPLPKKDKLIFFGDALH